MALQFILGSSGSGKSTYLYQKVVEESMKNPRQNYLILVPEQFTMQTQKELISLHPKHAIMNIDVLSFNRLAFRVFDELGKTDFVVLEETGKNLVLRKVAGEKQKELKVLGGNLKKMGYIGELKSLISEFMQYNVTPEMIETVSEKETSSFSYKMQDVVTMYQGFFDYLSLKTRGHIKNCCALLGWHISDEQVKKLKQKNITTVVSALDNDRCGEKGTELLKKYFDVIRFQYPEGVKDAGEMDERVLIET